MDLFEPFILELPQVEQQEKLRSIYEYLDEHFPQLGKRIAWNQPMYTHHDTFIMAFSCYKKHISVAPEFSYIEIFKDDIQKAGYEMTKGLFKIKWEDPVDFKLIHKIVEYTLEDKKDCQTFWKK